LHNYFELMFAEFLEGFADFRRNQAKQRYVR
jgi:hypothetical protein